MHVAVIAVKSSQSYTYSLVQRSTQYREELTLGPVPHTTPEKFENKGLNLKTHQMFSTHSTPKKFKNVTISRYFGFVFEETSFRDIIWLDSIVFEKSGFPIIFLPRENEEPALNSFGLKCVFEKLRFRDGLVWTVGLNWWKTSYIKAVFSNFSAQCGRWLLSLVCVTNCWYWPRLHDKQTLSTLLQRSRVLHLKETNKFMYILKKVLNFVTFKTVSLLEGITALSLVKVPGNLNESCCGTWVHFLAFFIIEGACKTPKP